MSDENVIEASDLTKSYGGVLAVDHIHFKVKRGETYGFLGPNGSGKTTTIRMLTGLSRPTDGKASVLGYCIDSSIVDIKKHIGVVPEISNLWDELSAMDNLLFMARLYGVPCVQCRKKAEELLATFGLYDRRDSLFRTLSRGMKRSLTIAAALIHEPNVLFLDEPTVGLDVVAARSLRNLISNLKKQGITIFLTTHYLEEADILCDRIAILVKGRIVEIDTPDVLKTHAEEKPAIEFSFNRETPGLNAYISTIISGVKVVTLDCNKVRIYSENPSDVYSSVFRFAERDGVKINSVNNIKPTLEDAFIKITGLNPIVMATEKGGK